MTTTTAAAAAAAPQISSVQTSLQTAPADATSRRPGRASRWPLWVCPLVATVLMFAQYSVAVPLEWVYDHLFTSAGVVTTTLLDATLYLSTLATAVGLVALVTRWALRGRLRDVGWVWTRDSLRMFGVGFVAMAAIAVPVALLPLPGGLTRTDLEPSPVVGLALVPALFVLAAQVLQGLALQAFPEELIWRGWLMNCLREHPRLALAVSATVFGALHCLSIGGQQSLAEHIAYCMQAMGFAFLGGALALRMRSLWCAIGVHSGLHMAGLALLFVPHRMTGLGTFALQAAVSLVVGLVVLRGHVPDRVRYER